MGVHVCVITCLPAQLCVRACACVCACACLLACVHVCVWPFQFINLHFNEAEREIISSVYIEVKTKLYKM